MARPAFIAAFCLLSAACTANYAEPPEGATAYDGRYVGTVSSAHVSANTCSNVNDKPGELDVKNGSVVWKTGPSAPMYAPVGQNGAFQVNENSLFLAGKITNDTMVARTNTGSCHLTYNLKRAA